MVIKDLNFITEAYPYGKGEEFIEKEILVLSKKFRTVNIYPSVKTDLNMRPVPDNVVVHPAPGNYSKFKTLAGNLFLVTKILVKEFFACNNKLFFLAHLKRFIGLICYGVHLIDHFNFSRNDKGYYYSFWMHEAALTLAILKDKGIINEFVFRVHGGDLFDERKEGNYMPFRNYIFERAKNIYSVSKAGRDYLAAKNIFPEKVKLSRLGVFDNGDNPFKDDFIFTLVSCSSLIPLKRVHLIIEALKHIKSEVRWVHFGDGPLKEQIARQASGLSKNIIVEFKGYQSNPVVMEYYKKEPVHLFVHVSEAEGLPVCIQEAISFGIPVLATDVGGVSEIVNEQTGILINKDSSPEEIARRIMEFKNSTKNSVAYRKGVKEFWQREFSAEENFGAFVKEITS